MITVIAEHSVDLTLLPQKANILDLGCRGFLFAKELTRLGHRVITVDPDYHVVGEHIEACKIYPEMEMWHYKVAISNYNGLCSLIRSNDPQAVSIKPGDDIDCITLKNLSERVCVDFWDILKIDVEGSEYEIILDLVEAPAKQISIEMHLHTGVYTMTEVKEMENKLYSLGYYAAKHELTIAHGLGYNYWDSLFILK